MPEVVSTYLEDAEAQQLRQRARAADRSLAAEVRRIVRAELHRIEQGEGTGHAH